MTDASPRTEKLDAAMTALADGVTQLLESDGWTEYLSTLSRFHTYSANNVLLILTQCPHASRVAGYRTWQSLDRQVRKGEKSLKILAPVVKKLEDPTTGEESRRVVAFTVASVFDVSQTDGDPLPEPARKLTGDADPALVDAVADLIADQGFSLTIGDVSAVHPGANGYTDHAGRQVVVHHELTPAQQLKTTVHELAHVILHHPDDPARPADRSLVEVEAESVAYVTLHALGINTGDYSLGYVAGWSGGDVDKIKTTAARVQKCAAQLIGKLESALQLEEVPA